MWPRIVAVASLASVLGAGVLLVAKSDRPEPARAPSGGASSDASAVSTISRGEEVDLAAHAGPGDTFTLFEFYADW
ncbi:MAG: hypothetical protein AAFU73_00275 [Planctomycetota bacterium]